MKIPSFTVMLKMISDKIQSKIMFCLNALDNPRRKEVCEARILSSSQRLAVPRLRTLTCVFWARHYAGQIQDIALENPIK